MKKLLACALVLFPLALFAVSSGGDHPVYINGKLFSRAVTINGILAVPLEDVSKAAGSPVSLEPAFQLRGNALLATTGWDVKKNVKTVAAKTSQQKVKVSDIHISKTYDKSSPLLFRVNRAGAITNNVLMLNGRAYVPLSDLAKAFGTTMLLGNLKPGESIQLNIAPNLNSILVGL